MEGVVSLGRGSVFAGEYKILEPLAAGGMGAVYIAEQLSTGRRRALKVMRPELVANPELRKRFEQEARIGAKIDSEHVVEVHAAGIDPATGMPWLVMELLAGEDLAKTIERRGALPPNEARAVLEQLCHAIGAAHAAGIVHRDLKPETPTKQLCWNRLASKEGTCAVGSFAEGKSRFGLFDMSGNVWEWTSSGWSDNYAKERVDSARVARGGGWSNGNAPRMRSTMRDKNDPATRYYSLGFRCAQDE
jgi:hypothetical protein